MCGSNGQEVERRRRATLHLWRVVLHRSRMWLLRKGTGQMEVDKGIYRILLMMSREIQSLNEKIEVLILQIGEIEQKVEQGK